MDGIDTAFSLLIEELKHAILMMHEQVDMAMEQHNYAQAKEVIGRADKLQQQLKALLQVQQAIEAMLFPLPPEASPVTAINAPLQVADNASPGAKSARLPKGLRTPDAVYYPYILRAIVELGGSASIHDVIRLVGDRMRDQFNEYDWQPIASTPDEPRWKNAICWARMEQINQGLLLNNSPRGIWAISEQGRAWLETRA